MESNSPVIALKCTSCGSNLEISSDIEVFACGYCGTQQMVQRKGGTISLKAVVSAVSKVQEGTDKTAAELALVRLREELHLAEEALFANSNAYSNAEPVEDIAYMVACIGCGVVTVFSGFAAFATSSIIGGAISAVFAIGFIAFAAAHSQKKAKLEAKAKEERQVFLKPYTEKYLAIKKKYDEAKKVVDS